MGVLDKFENGVDDAFDKAGAAVFKGPLQPAQIARRAEKQMKREKLVGSGKQYAPTLYTILVSPKDDTRLFAFYPTMAAEVETYLMSKGADQGLTFDGRPLVRFIVDKKLKSGKLDVIAENVSATVIDELRKEEADFYGLHEDDQEEISEPSTAQHKEDASPLNVRSIPQVGAAAGAAGVSESAVQAALRVIDGGNTDDEFVPVSKEAKSRSIVDMPLDDGDGNFDPHAPAQGSSWLIDQSTGQRHELRFVEMSIGRDADNDIVVNDANASRRHALIHQNIVGAWKIIDLHSTNGTLLNDHPVDQMILHNGDELTIGVTLLEFKTSANY